MNNSRKLSLANKREKAKRAQTERQAKHPKPEAVPNKAGTDDKDGDDKD